MAQGRLRLGRLPGPALYVQSAALSGRPQQRDARLCDIRALRDRETDQSEAEDFPDRGLRLQQLFDPDLDTAGHCRAEARTWTAFGRCHATMLWHIYLSREFTPQSADPTA